MTMNEIKRLKQIKSLRGASYESMAPAIGITQRTLYRWLGGKTKPSLMGLMLIQRYLDAEEARTK
jgi:transcriptional regulator with XRE-family HTH domain